MLATLPLVPFWIDGQPAAAHSTRLGIITNPSTGAPLRQVPLAGAVDVDTAVQSARRAFPGWRATTPLRRSRILARFRELLEVNQTAIATLISEEHGKVFLDAMGSVQRGIEVVEFATGAPHLLKGAFSEEVGRDVDAYSILQPVGVCAGITPFNFPAMVPLWMLPMALACGNTFILKPSEKDPSPSILMAELLTQAGLPPGVFNVVHGDKEAVEALLAHIGVDAISFVGSTPIAKHIYTTAAAAGKRVQALGGAKNHAVVMPDADMTFTADAIMGAAYGAELVVDGRGLVIPWHEGGFFVVRGLEGVALRRPARARCRRGKVLHAHQGGDAALDGRPDRRRVPHADDVGVGSEHASATPRRLQPPEPRSRRLRPSPALAADTRIPDRRRRRRPRRPDPRRSGAHRIARPRDIPRPRGVGVLRWPHRP